MRSALSSFLLAALILPAGCQPSEPATNPNATLGFALPVSAARPFVQALWDLPVPTGQYRYYNGMLYMLSLVHASGKFQLWF